MKLVLLLDVFIVAVILQCEIASASSYLQNENVVRLVDITTQLVVINEKVTVVNIYDEPAESYDYVVDPSLIHDVAFLKVIDDTTGDILQTKQVQKDDSEFKLKIFFHNSLVSGESKRIEVIIYFTDCLRSHPKSVMQNEKHKVLFSLNAYYYSVYFTVSVTTYLYPGKTEVMSVDGANYKVTADNGLKYGPYLNIEAKSELLSVIHYENNSPFLVVEKLKRYVKPSFWGSLFVVDQVTIVHNGPTFKGPFKRAFSLEKNIPSDTRIEKYVTTLPAWAEEILLRDELGYIFSYHVSYSDNVEVTIKPRYVLYGGWKTQYEISYTLPVSDHLSYDKNTYSLYVPFVDKIFPNMIIKEAEVIFVLPEGGKFMDLSPTFELKNNTGNKYCGFLDVLCREVVSFKTYNLIEHHTQEYLTLTYSYSTKFYLLVKPLLITAVLYILFLMFILYRLVWGSEQKPNIAVERVYEMQAQLKTRQMVPLKNISSPNKKYKKKKVV